MTEAQAKYKQIPDLKEARPVYAASKLIVLLLILMFVPGTPKDILTYLTGLTPIRLPAWRVIVSAGILSVDLDMKRWPFGIAELLLRPYRLWTDSRSGLDRYPLLPKAQPAGRQGGRRRLSQQSIW